jgi:hypothetical protein
VLRVLVELLRLVEQEASILVITIHGLILSHLSQAMVAWRSVALVSIEP